MFQKMTRPHVGKLTESEAKDIDKFIDNAKIEYNFSELTNVTCAVENSEVEYLCEEYPINPPEGTKQASVDICKTLNSESGYTHCCYVPEDDETPCSQLTDKEYNDMKSFTESMKEEYDMEKLTVKCGDSSNIISPALFFIIFSLFELLI